MQTFNHFASQKNVDSILRDGNWQPGNVSEDDTPRFTTILLGCFFCNIHELLYGNEEKKNTEKEMIWFQLKMNEV